MAEEQGKIGNPAVVGLAGFGLTTLMLQFHNLMPANVGLGPIVALGLMFGGLAQLIAGLQEIKTGNNFGYSAFTSYGAFWISLALIFVFKSKGLFVQEIDQGLGYFLIAWTIYTAIMFIGAMRIHGALAFTFLTLLIGFIFLDIHSFTEGRTSEITQKIAGWDLVVCALSAWYVMAHVIYEDVFGKNILPVGKPWIGRHE